MDLVLAKREAYHYLWCYGLKQRGWEFKFNKRLTSFGVCKHNKKIIELSMPLTEASNNIKVTDTILHEIAHALVGSGHNHDEIWRRKALEIGCDGERCGGNENMLVTIETLVEKKRQNYKYKLVCPNCKKETYKRSEPTRELSCGICFSRRYNPEFKLILKYNE